MKTSIIISSFFLLAAFPFINANEQQRSALESNNGTSHYYPAAASTKILFAIEGQGIMSYEMGTSAVSTVVNNDKNLMGIGYDWINNKIYYCRLSVYLLLEAEIYRSNIDGTEIEILETNRKFTYPYDIAFDWRTGNLYVISNDPVHPIDVCKTTTTSSSLICTTLPTPTGVGYFLSIALDPLRGEMFIASIFGVYRAEMDGSNFTDIAPAGYTAGGISLDPTDSDRLYWTDRGNDRIVSSRKDGSDIQTIVQLDTADPFGLIALNGSLYWGSWYGRALQRSSTTGEDVVALYNSTSRINHMTVVPSPDLVNEFRNGNRVSNPCEGQVCSHICVLTANSFRCLCPDGLNLAEDRMNCVDA